MLKLYEIEQNYLAALDLFTDPDEDIPPEVVAGTLEAIEGEFELKAVRIAAFAKQMEAEAEAIKEAADRMEKRRKSLEARARWLRDYVKIGMETMGQKKLTSAWFVLSVQKNPAALDLYNEAAIPVEYKRTETITVEHIDKAAIKNALGLGRVIPGARLTNGTRLAIR
jgi:hypothetical protein